MSHADEKIVFNVIEADGKLTALHDGHFGIKPKAITNPPVPTWTDPGTNWAYWGDNDLLPTTMRTKMEAVPIAGAAIAKKVNMMIGEGLAWYRTEELHRLGADAEPVYLPEVEDFMEENRILTEWFPAQCADYCLPYNCFSELNLSLDRKKITGLYHISAEHARLSKANKINQVDWLIYSYHFAFGTAQNENDRVPMPLYKWYNRQSFLDNLRGYKFAWHSRFPTPGMIYYARPWWLGLFKDNGWMDVSSNVPRIVYAMQKNQISLKYMILFPESYFTFRHPEWQGYDLAQRQEIIDAKQTEINTYLSDVDNAGKSLMSIFRENEVNGAPMGKPEIVAIDDKAKTGTWVPDSNFADLQIVQGIGMDPSQIGLQPDGGKMGAGSGSDKMQSFNQHILLNTNDQRLVLEPLNFISKYNGWGLTAMVKHTTLTTQDQNRSGVNLNPPNPNPPAQ